MAAAYHMEALRKQRIIERKHAALARIAICQVGILSWNFFRRIVWSVFMVFNWYIYSVVVDVLKLSRIFVLHSLL